MAAGDALNGLAIGALPGAADLMIRRARSRLDGKGWHPSSPFAKGASRPMRDKSMRGRCVGGSGARRARLMAPVAVATCRRREFAAPRTLPPPVGPRGRARRRSCRGRSATILAAGVGAGAGLEGGGDRSGGAPEHSRRSERGCGCGRSAGPPNVQIRWSCSQLEQPSAACLVGSR